MVSVEIKPSVFPQEKHMVRRCFRYGFCFHTTREKTHEAEDKNPWLLVVGLNGHEMRETNEIKRSYLSSQAITSSFGHVLFHRSAFFSYTSLDTSVLFGLTIIPRRS